MNRREFITMTSVGTTAALTGASHAAEPPHVDPLPGTQSAPLPDLGTHWPFFEKLSTPSRPAMSFLEDKYKDIGAWSKEARATLLADFHYRPEPCDPKPELVETVDCETHVRERVLINTTPHIRIPVYVLIPKNLDKPAPAMVALHDHGGFYIWGKEKLIDVAPEHPALTEFKRTYYGGRGLADELARRGYAVIVSDMMHWGERGLYFDADPERIANRTMDVTQKDIQEFNARSWAHEELVARTALAAGVTWSGINMWDDIRVTDYFLTRPEVDAKRVGCIGLSLGCVRSIFLGALHEAVRASVSVCWTAEYSQMLRNNVRNGIGFTKLVPGLYGDLDWPDLAGLHLPGHLMTINGLQDMLYPLKAAQDAVAKIERIFEKAGKRDHYEGVFFDGPHEFNLDMQEKAFAWLQQVLA
ncbi:MAG: alpha/beta hydrolase family protein [Candidatus Hydrogenedentes bacterium]|nr:alpha/beta hydrolase family protein [Candidatus Hydrogenedentota bacterium]